MEPGLEELRAEVRALRDEVAHLQAELAAGAAMATAPPTAPPPTAPAAVAHPSAPSAALTRRRVLAGLAGAAGVGAGVAVVGAAATAGPAGAAPLSDGTTDLGEGLVDWSSANPAATLRLANRGGGSPLVVNGSSEAAPAVRVEQANGAQPAMVLRQTSRLGTAPALDVVALNHANAISAQGVVVGVSGVGAVYGVEGQSFANGGVGVSAGGPKAALRLKAAGPAPSGREDEYFGGEVVLDEDGTLWCCVAAGRPGVWREVASVRSAGVLHVSDAPARVYDSRTGDGTPLADGQERIIGLGTAVPATAQAAMFSVTSTGSSAPGSLTLSAAGTTWPGVTSLSFAGADVTGTVLTQLSAAGVTVRVVGDRVTTHVLIDLIGWYG